MDKNLQNTEFTKHFADWQGTSAFNTYWQYSYVNRSAYYANIKGEYYEYMHRWVQNYLWWYDGWVPYFHNSDQGIFSTKIASALVNGAAKKVVGGRVFFKTKNREKNLAKDDKGQYKVNKALSFITTQWAPMANFSREMKKAITFAAAAGTSLLKLDKQGEELVAKALRFDSFYPTVGFNGKIIELICFIKDFTKLTSFDNKSNKSNFDNFYVVEHRYFGDYVDTKGEKHKNVPLVRYEIKRTQGTITTGQEYDTKSESIDFLSLPRDVRSAVAKSFSGVMFDSPIRLPFNDSLGAELINWTDCVSAVPELPFGESLLYNIMPYLQSYDYYWSAFNTDMYIGRGRVLIPKQMQSSQAKNSNEYNSGLDSMLFTKIQVPGMGEELKPTPIQFDLRSSSWQEIRTMIIQNISINTGLNLATIASFLQDTNAARTAREISTEESETALFVDDKREIVERPINRILRLVTLFYSFQDEIVLRWSSAGLSNIYSRTEMIAQAVGSGFLSRKKAMQMFNQDDDEYQLQEEFDNIQQDKQKESNSFDDFGGDLDGKDKEFPSAFDIGDGGDGNKDVGEEQLFDVKTKGADGQGIQKNIVKNTGANTSS